MLSRTRRRRLSRSFVAFAAICGTPAVARANDCTTAVTRTAPGSIEGAYIRTVTVRTESPVILPFAGEWLASLRRTTETAVVWRQLLFAPGDRADTARVAETLRRLRDQRVYADVALGVQCAGGDTVDLVVTTRDAWTLRPIARVVPPSTFSIGGEDRNLLGTGRFISLTGDQTARGHGGTVAFTDPFLFNRDLIGATRFSDVAGTHLFRALIRQRQRSIFDDWRGEIAVGRQTFNDSLTDEHPLASVYLAANIGHRIGSSTNSVTVPYIGVELDSGGVIATRGADTMPSLHSRRFMGVDLGLLHRAAEFDTVGWFVPTRGFLDSPRGFEEDILVSPGTDRGEHAFAARYDAWAGRIWIPERGRMLTADIWTSGYAGHVRSNHIDRVAINEYNEARGGFWGGRLMFEQLLELDPDLRGVTLASIGADPTFSAVPALFRQANRAAFASVERAVHLLPFGRASMIDAGVFGAASLRWDAPNTTTQSFGLATVGVRLRVISTNGLVNSTRVDLSYPALVNSPIARRPLLSISLGPLFEVARTRDGRRRQQ
jgi:hypothetical protein